ncbi:hypothetical protein VTN49DRAFT_6084 [Thermomyces lanuginosus]|uniref:uncharacterized protein n=1 Tax=Thermomyces lanuginosus TaxID=5541 RepID=UPI0037448700
MAPSDEIRVGDQVNVPGGMYGVVRYLGPVEGKPGRFAGIELAPEHAARGKNNGDVDGRSYFTTTIPGAGIFVPINNSKYVTKRTVTTPPTPSRPSMPANFSKSVGPQSVPRPQVRRPSLPRPESPRAAPAPASTTGPKLSLSGLRSPSVGSKVQPPRSGLNAGARSPLKTPSRLSDRPPSRVSVDDEPPTPSARLAPRNVTNDAEVQELREKVRKLEQELQDRDRQLEEQAVTLNELQQSITELEGADGASIRQQLREKNEKIAQLTAEFDSHRADFRSTLDTLEVAASETERVYERRLEELQQQVRELQDRGEDVETVARQLKQLEELVSELEEGLEDARRGEAEARGEVEFLRGEVERTKLELEKEREKSAGSQNDGDSRRYAKELEQKDDEIRGLKAIIHSLSRGDVNPALLNQNGAKQKSASDTDTAQLQQRIVELETLLEARERRIEELQRELQSQNRNSTGRMSANGFGRRDRSGTVTVAPLRQMKSNRNSSSSNPPSHSHTLSDRTVVPADLQESSSGSEQGVPRPATQNGGRDPDNTSSEASSTLWCEICETNGHDILTCTTFSNNGSTTTSNADGRSTPAPGEERKPVDAAKPAGPPHQRTSSGLRPLILGSQAAVQQQKTGRDAVLEGLKGINSTPMSSMSSSMTPVAGKASGVIDESKWCALCERDGHESIDCPFEE